MKYQVTIYAEKYKPISTIINTDSVEKKDIISQGVVKICATKYWSKNDLQKYGYLKAKCRPYKEENKG